MTPQVTNTVKNFSTLTGVFMPTFLTILRVEFQFPIGSKLGLSRLHEELNLLKNTRTDLNIIGLAKDNTIEELIAIVTSPRNSAQFCLNIPNENSLV